MTASAGTKAIKAAYCGTKDQRGLYVPVRWSQADTDETIAQVKGNNAVYKELC